MLAYSCDAIPLSSAQCVTEHCGTSVCVRINSSVFFVHTVLSIAWVSFELVLAFIEQLHFYVIEFYTRNKSTLEDDETWKHLQIR